MKRLFLLPLCALLLALAAPAKAQGPKPGVIVPKNVYGYLYCHMSGDGEWTAFALSRDGENWHDLNRGREVYDTQALSQIEHGARDAFITRAAGGKSFVMVTTDMKVAVSHKWDNYGINLLKSDDLIHWTSTTFDFRKGPGIFCDPESPDTYKDYSTVRRVWAPQCLWDATYTWPDGQKGGYFVYYSLLNDKNGEDHYDRMYYSYADRSFTKLTKPRLLFDWGYATIDADINYLESDGLYHMLIKKEGGKRGIFTTKSKSLTGPWPQPDESDYVSFEGNKLTEGSSAWQVAGEDGWRVSYIEYSSNPKHYRTCKADKYMANFHDPEDIKGVAAPQHGSFMPLTKEEYTRLDNYWAQKLAKGEKQGAEARAYWASLAWKMAQPVLENMAKGELQKNMQTEFSPSFDNRNRKVLYMECFGRLMAGIAPWLTLPDDATAEGRQRKQLREWALASYKNAVDPQSPDYLCWGIGGQNLVDAAYIAESFIRAYDTLWKPLDETTKQRYLKEFAKLRAIDPPYTNWLLFSSTIESFIKKATAEGLPSGAKWETAYDEYRVNSACRKMEEWYVGDGWYSDGPTFAFDYYSSYVFHPMYLETLQNMIDGRANTRLDYGKYRQRELQRCQKYAIILERLISPEGTFPVFGRSIPYRMAAMQPLALMAWYNTLPKDLSNGQVRAALTKTLHRMFDQEQNFNDGGYLTIGFCGSQPGVADWYTNNGSLYMTTLAFMPLGLAPDSDFWTCEDEPWTQVKAWNGKPFPKDHIWRDNIQTSDRW